MSGSRSPIGTSDPPPHTQVFCHLKAGVEPSQLLGATAIAPRLLTTRVLSEWGSLSLTGERAGIFVLLALG